MAHGERLRDVGACTNVRFMSCICSENGRRVVLAVTAQERVFQETCDVFHTACNHIFFVFFLVYSVSSNISDERRETPLNAALSPSSGSTVPIAPR